MYDLSPLPVVTLLGAASWVIVRLLLRTPVLRLAAEALLAGYVAALLHVAVYPQLPVSPGDVDYVSSSVNLVPFGTVIEIIRGFRGQVVRQLIGNVSTRLSRVANPVRRCRG